MNFQTMKTSGLNYVLSITPAFNVYPSMFTILSHNTTVTAEARKHDQHLPRKFAGDATNFKQKALSCKNWCWSASASVVATLSTFSSSHRKASHSIFNLPRSQRSAAANRCCIMFVNEAVEVDPVISCTSGSTSVQMKLSIAYKKISKTPSQYNFKLNVQLTINVTLKIEGSMSSMTTLSTLLFPTGPQN